MKKYAEFILLILATIAMMFALCSCSTKEVLQEIKLKTVEIPEVKTSVPLFIKNASDSDAVKIRDVFSSLPDSAYIEGTATTTDSLGHVSTTNVKLYPKKSKAPKDISGASKYVGTADIDLTQSPLQIPDTSSKEKKEVTKTEKFGYAAYGAIGLTFVVWLIGMFIFFLVKK